MLAALGVLAAGCRLDIRRDRVNRPFAAGAYDSLRPGSTSRGEALERLGAPDRVEWRGGDDYLRWLYLDATTVNLRFQVPVAFFGYRHNFFQYLDDHEQANELTLVFDRQGLLKHKRRRLARPYAEEGAARTWRLHLTPRYERSFLLAGDAGVRDFADLFRGGFLSGLELGLQPVPPVVLQLGGYYGEYPGEELAVSGQRLDFDTLELITTEVVLRFQVPLRILADLGDFAAVRALLLESDPARYDGFLLFVEGGLGATFNGNVPVRIDGRRAGNFFDDSWGLSSSASTGVEYSWKHLSLRLAVTYRSVDAFDEGNAPLSADASSFQTLAATASLSVKL